MALFILYLACGILLQERKKEEKTLKTAVAIYTAKPRVNIPGWSCLHSQHSSHFHGFVPFPVSITTRLTLICLYHFPTA